MRHSYSHRERLKKEHRREKEKKKAAFALVVLADGRNQMGIATVVRSNCVAVQGLLIYCVMK